MGYNILLNQSTEMLGQLQQPLALISWKSALIYIIKDFFLKNFKSTSQFKN